MQHQQYPSSAAAGVEDSLSQQQFSPSSSRSRRRTSPPSSSPKVFNSLTAKNEHGGVIAGADMRPDTLRWMKGFNVDRMTRELMKRDPSDEMKKTAINPLLPKKQQLEQKKRLQRSNQKEEEETRRHHEDDEHDESNHQEENSNNTNEVQNNNNSNSRTRSTKPSTSSVSSKEVLLSQEARRDRSERMFKVAEALGRIKQLASTDFMISENDYQKKPGDEGYEEVYTKRNGNARNRQQMMMNPEFIKRSRISSSNSNNNARKGKDGVLEISPSKKKRADGNNNADGEKNKNDTNEEGLPTLSARNRQQLQEKERASSATAFQQLQSQRTNAALRVFARGFQRVVPANNHRGNQKKNGNTNNTNSMAVVGGNNNHV